MTALALLIIVISGHLFVDRRPLSRFKQAKSSGWDAYFHVGAWGTLFAVISALFIAIGMGLAHQFGYSPHRILPELSLVLAQVIQPGHLALFCWATLTCLLGLIFGLLANSEKHIKRAVAEITLTDELDHIFYVAVAQERLIQVTTKSRKIYIGFATTQITNDDFSRREYTAILPFASGYRDKDTLKIQLVNDYHGFYNRTGEDLSQYKVVIPVAEISCVAFFDHAAYSHISQANAPISDSTLADAQFALP
ncbi:MAG: hypothetical protein JO171_07750 [Paludibacterium sp.]|uniref:hypothetical protein n=1 Tax=Paludibacterium sp. TaxID=1917523 RepID=UPI0025F085C7|nr:hypothetical protein [Paludibacterium sp.]MBV8047028.1 hypothetical protein [Paludibacterium sp.]MBV8648172.1 hypothetical protein [Paludibacterium sp.]